MERLIFTHMNQQELQDYFMDMFNRECRISFRNAEFVNPSKFGQKFYDKVWKERTGCRRIPGTRPFYAIFKPQTPAIEALFLLTFGNDLVIEIVDV